MYKKFTAFLLGICFCVSAFAQCAESNEPRVLLVGDSWAFFMGVDQTINRIFDRWGHSHYTYYTNATLAENGAQTDDFLTATKQNEIAAQLSAHPSIKVVHLSIGGNDFLGDWNVNMTQAQTDSLIDSVEVKLIAVIDFIKSLNPDIQILWSGYTYTNFGEVIESSAPFQTSHPYYSTWEGMGFPDFLQINELLNKVSARIEQYIQTTDRVHFVNATGILQYEFGQTTPLGVPPGGSYPPYTVPLPQGNPAYPSPRNSMRDYLLTKDCFHLSPDGFDALIGYHTQKFYHKFLMDDLYLLAENNTQTGTVSSLGNVFPSLQMGTDNNETFATVLTFNTTNMPDTTLAGASIFLRRESVTGTNPISNSMQLSIKQGNIGTSADVEAGDFTATVDVTETPCLFGSNDGDKHWIRLDLPAAFLPYIQQGAITQFILSAPNAANGKVTFSDATNPDFAPVLNLVYEKPNIAITSPTTNISRLAIYPNPAQTWIYLSTQGNTTIHELTCINAFGQKIWTKQSPGKTINIADLPTGMYYLKANTSQGILTTQLIKQ